MESVVIKARVRVCEGGWIPVMVDSSGREHWEWRRDSYDRDVAAGMALVWARDEADRYVGNDWQIEIVDQTDL